MSQWSCTRQATRLALLTASTATAAFAQPMPTPPPPRTTQPAVALAARAGVAHVVTTAPVIDGKLDEAVWKDATPFDGFIQREAHEGDPATERTEVRILTDGEALYIGAWLFDREPQGIVAGEKLRDVLLTNSDYFAIILDTYLDKQNGFVFATTPAEIGRASCRERV